MFLNVIENKSIQEIKKFIKQENYQSKETGSNIRLKAMSLKICKNLELAADSNH